MIVKYFTLARKFPQLLGRTPTGGRIWGGPYTMTQAAGGVIVLALAAKTMFLWGRFGFWMNIALLAGVTAGAVFALGKIPIGSRSPVSWSVGAIAAVTRPRFGELRGSPARIRQTKAPKRSRLLIQPSPHLLAASPQSRAADVGLAIVPGISAPPAPPAGRKRRGRRVDEDPQPSPIAPVPAPIVQLSGVQLLLAASAASTAQERTRA